jgi:DNA polymerase theta
LCKDPKLTATIEKPNDDIFRQIAADWNKIDEKNVTDLQRNQTKQLCYGVIYGMGYKALATKMDVGEEEAKRIVEKFHATYQKIKKYSTTLVEKARKDGYIETLTCRRRYLPAINSQDRRESSKAERQALNSNIQGSASDLVKNAIVTMEKNLKKKNFEDDDCFLVLHLHDELFYEVKESKWKEAMNILTESMEKCVKLKVPLKVKVKKGISWGEMIEVKRK